MCHTLDGIGVDLATMKSDDETAFMLRQLIEHLNWTLRELADRPGIFPEPAPW